MTENENTSYCLPQPLISQSHQRDLIGRLLVRRLWERFSSLIREKRFMKGQCLSFSTLGHYCESTSYLELLQPSCIQEDGQIECESLASEPALGPDFILCETHTPRVFIWLSDWYSVIYSPKHPDNIQLLSHISPIYKEKYPTIDLVIQ